MKQNKPSLRKLTHFREDIRAFNAHALMRDKNRAVKESEFYLDVRLYCFIFDKETVDVPATRLYDTKIKEKETHGDRCLLPTP